MGGVGIPHRALQIEQLLQPLVQRAHPIAGIPLAQVDVAGALAGVGIIQLDQGLPGGIVADGQVVLGLEQLNGLLGAHPKDSVGTIRQIAQAAQALLHLLNAQAPGPICLGQIGIVFREIAAQDGPLQLFIGYAGNLHAQIPLEQAHRPVGAGAKNAVDIVIIIAVVIQRLLNGAHRIAPAAPAQRGILHRGLKHRPGRFLSLQRHGLDQHGLAVLFIQIGGVFHEGKDRLLGLSLSGCVHIEQAVHGQNGIAFARLIPLGLKRTQIQKGFQCPRFRVDPIHHIVQPQHKEAVLAGRNLEIQINFRGQEHLLLQGGGIIHLHPGGASGIGQIVDLSILKRKIEHIRVHQIRPKAVRMADIQVAPGDIDLITVHHPGLGGNRIAEGFKGTGVLRIDHRPGILHIGGHQPIGRLIQPAQRLLGGIDQLRLAVGQVDTIELCAVSGRDIIQRVASRHAGGVHILGHHLLLKGGKIHYGQISPLYPIRLNLYKIGQPVGIDGNYGLHPI